MSCFFFFFFKQKTAYEMRISDWSSDVCSSDLRRRAQSRHEPALSVQPPVRPGNRADHARPAISQHIGKAAEGTRPRHRAWPVPRWHGEAGADRGNDIDRVGPDDDGGARGCGRGSLTARPWRATSTTPLSGRHRKSVGLVKSVAERLDLG